MVEDSDDARETCRMASGYTGSRQPWFVMRFTSGELNRLPQQLLDRIATGKYHQAAVGACAVQTNTPFSSYSITVLLYP